MVMQSTRPFKSICICCLYYCECQRRKFCYVCCLSFVSTNPVYKQSPLQLKHDNISFPFSLLFLQLHVHSEPKAQLFFLFVEHFLNRFVRPIIFVSILLDTVNYLFISNALFLLYSILLRCIRNIFAIHSNRY